MEPEEPEEEEPEEEEPESESVENELDIENYYQDSSNQPIKFSPRQFVDAILYTCGLTTFVQRKRLFAGKKMQILIDVLNVCINDGIIRVNYVKTPNPGAKLLNFFMTDNGGLNDSKDLDERFGTEERSQFKLFESSSRIPLILKQFIQSFTAPQAFERRSTSSPPAKPQPQRIKLSRPINWNPDSPILVEQRQVVSAPRRLQTEKHPLTITITGDMKSNGEQVILDDLDKCIRCPPNTNMILVPGGRQIIINDTTSGTCYTSNSGPGNLSYRRDYTLTNKNYKRSTRISIPSLQTLSGVQDRWKFHYDPLGNSGVYCSATSAQGLLDEMFFATIDRIFVPTEKSLFLPRFIAPIIMGRLISPSSTLHDPLPGSTSRSGVFPGFFTPLSPEQKNHLSTTFDSQNPCCASGVRCLYRREFSEDNDPRLWREIYFCQGQLPYVVDTVDLNNPRCPTFMEIYKGLEKIGFPYNWKYSSPCQVFVETSYSFQLYSIELPTSADTSALCIGLAVMISEGSHEPLRDVIGKVQAKLLALASIFHSDWYIPRIIRVFQSGLMAPPIEFQRYGYSLLEQDIFSNDTSDHLVYVYHSEDHCYKLLDASNVAHLEKTYFASVWGDVIPKKNLSFAITLPCAMNSSEKAPNIWYHAGCLDAENSTNDILTKHSHLLGQCGATIRYSCPCCNNLLQKGYLNPDTGVFPPESRCAGKYPRNMIEAFGKIDIKYGATNYIYRCTMPSAVKTPTANIQNIEMGPKPCFKEIFGPQHQSDFFLQSRF